MMRFERCTVLLVDDVPEDRAVYRRFLEHHPECRYEVLEADSGEQALAACRERRPDCILLDYGLPDGAILDALMRQSAGDPYAVVMLTGSSDLAIAVQTLKSGALDYLNKNDLSAEQLHRSIHYAMATALLRRELERQRLWFRGALSSIAEAVIATDPEGRVMFMNGRAETLTGWLAEMAHGKPLDEIYTVVNGNTRQAVAPYAPAEATVSEAERVLLVRADGRETPIEHSAAPIHAANGDILGSIVVARDITQRRRTDALLEEREERLALVTRAAGDAVWDWDLATGHLWWNDVYESRFGRPITEGRPGLRWSRAIHPLDRNRVVDQTRGALEDGGETWICEYRCRRRDGHYVDVIERAFIVRDPGGRPRRVVATMLDCSEHRARRIDEGETQASDHVTPMAQAPDPEWEAPPLSAPRSASAD